MSALSARLFEAEVEFGGDICSLVHFVASSSGHSLLRLGGRCRFQVYLLGARFWAECRWLFLHIFSLEMKVLVHRKS